MCLSGYPCVFVCLFVYLSICLSIYLSVCLFVCMTLHIYCVISAISILIIPHPSYVPLYLLSAETRGMTAAEAEFPPLPMPEGWGSSEQVESEDEEEGLGVEGEGEDGEGEGGVERVGSSDSQGKGTGRSSGSRGKGKGTGRGKGTGSAEQGMLDTEEYVEPEPDMRLLTMREKADISLSHLMSAHEIAFAALQIEMEKAKEREKREKEGSGKDGKRNKKSGKGSGKEGKKKGKGNKKDLSASEKEKEAADVEKEVEVVADVTTEGGEEVKAINGSKSEEGKVGVEGEGVSTDVAVSVPVTGPEKVERGDVEKIRSAVAPILGKYCHVQMFEI